ncbi:MAG: DUF6912 family protein [Nocardioidaceae bacterium]
MRVYVPLAIAELRALATTRRLPGPLEAYAVTSPLRVWVGSNDDEELEYAALTAAAAASRARFDPGAPEDVRRIVVAVDVPDAAVITVDDDAAEPGCVVVGRSVSLAQVASVHVDTGAAADDEDLAWYATSELDDLLG